MVTDYLEDVLLPEMGKRLEAHLAECPGCEHYIEQVRLTIDMLHRAAQEPGFPGTKTGVASALSELEEALGSSGANPQ